MLPSPHSLIKHFPRPFHPLLTKVLNFGPQSLSLYRDYILSQDIHSALSSSTSHRSPYFPSTSRPFAPLPRSQFLHIRRTRLDVKAAGPTAVFCLLPFVGYFGVLGAFLKPRFFLSRQFYEGGEVEKYGWEDVEGRVKHYDDVMGAIERDGVDLGRVREALIRYKDIGKVDSVINDFTDRFKLERMSRSHLVNLAASRGLNRFHEVFPLLSLYPKSNLIKGLKREAEDMKRDDWLVLNELGGVGKMGEEEIREAMVDRGIRKGREDMLEEHVGIVGKEVGFLDSRVQGGSGDDPVICESLILHMPIILHHAPP